MFEHKRYLLHIIVLISLITLLSGCGDEEDTLQEPVDEADTHLSSGYLTDEPVELTFFNVFSSMPFDGSWAVFQEVAKRTNVQLVGSVPLGTVDEKAAYNLMLSSGNLADIISYDQITDLEKLGRDGGVIPLNDLIDQYAPHLKKVLDENERFRHLATATDGQIYCIPRFQDWPVAKGYFIRQDWLDRLGLEVPTDLNTLYEVLKAFREEDPNGNGLKDEVPYFNRFAENDYNDLFSLWGTSILFRYRDGKVQYDPLEEDFVAAIKDINKWYAEGLIDPEIFTRGKKSRDELLNKNLGGFTHDWFGSTSNFNDFLSDEYEGFYMKPILPPKDQLGRVLEYTTRGRGTSGWSISSQCDDPVTAMKLFDYFFTEEGHEFINFGIEGLTYTKENGVYTFTDVIMKSDQSALSNLRKYGVQYRIGSMQDFEYERAWLNEIAIEGMELYINAGVVSKEVEEILTIKYTEEQEDELTRIMNNVDVYVRDMVQKWVIGVSDFESDYPSFIAELKRLKIDRAIEITEAARLN